MVPHKYRLLGLVLFALAEVAITLLAAFDVISADTALKIGTTLAGLGAVLGLTDAGIVEARRRDPSVTAIKDDRIAPSSIVPPLAIQPREPIPSGDINTPGPFHVPPGVREDSNHGEGQ